MQPTQYFLFFILGKYISIINKPLPKSVPLEQRAVQILGFYISFCLTIY
ncbi:hypothetical protein APA_414 [Pseudanabaena sp. lw0831]|nr:hypothetical protein APA_414 [Pseudanabaena sp. lw0831]